MNTALVALIPILVASAPSRAGPNVVSAELEPAYRLELALEFEAALAAYEQQLERPGHPVNVQVLSRVVYLSEALSKPGRILRASRQIREEMRYDLAAEWAGLAGEMFERRGDRKEALRAYLNMLKLGERHGLETIRLEARLGLGRVRMAMSHINHAQTELERIVKIGDRTPPEEHGALAPIAAEATFLLATIENRRIDGSYPGSLEPSGIARLLEAKIAALSDAHKRLETVFAYGIPRWSAEAALLSGRLYKRFAEWLKGFPPPREIPAEMHDAYLQALEDKGQPIYEKACQAFQQTATFVADKHVNAPAGRAAREELRALESWCSEVPFPWERLRWRPLHPHIGAPQAEARLERARRALEKKPGDEAALLSAAEALLNLERSAEANHIVKWLVSSDRRVPLLVRAYWATGKEWLAHASAGMFLMDFPERSEVRASLAEMNMAFGDLSAALENLRLLEMVGPMNAAWPLARGVALAGQGRFKDARRAFETVLELDPDIPEARYNLAVLLVHGFDATGSGPARLQRMEYLQMAAEHLAAYQRAVGEVDAAARDLERLIQTELRALGQLGR